MSPAQLTRPCSIHADRVGFAVCMSCKTVLCQECATTFDGINYCRPCLAKLGGGEARGTSLGRLSGHILVGCVLAGLLVACVKLMAWNATVLAGFR